MERNICLLSIETQKVLHIVSASVLARDILFRKGNLKQEGRFKKVGNGNGIEWQTLSGGSFSTVRSKSFFDVIKQKFTGSPKSSELKRPIPMKTVQTKAWFITDQEKEPILISDHFMIWVFPAQWQDTKEIQSVLRHIQSFIKKDDFITIVSMGNLIDKVQDEQSLYAEFQASMNISPFKLRFRRVALNPDEICEVIEETFKKI